MRLRYGGSGPVKRENKKSSRDRAREGGKIAWKVLRNGSGIETTRLVPGHFAGGCRRNGGLQRKRTSSVKTVRTAAIASQNDRRSLGRSSRWSVCANKPAYSYAQPRRSRFVLTILGSFDLIAPLHVDHFKWSRIRDVRRVCVVSRNKCPTA